MPTPPDSLNGYLPPHPRNLHRGRLGLGLGPGADLMVLGRWTFDFEGCRGSIPGRSAFRQQPCASCLPLLPSSNVGTGERAVMPCGWEGNRRSGVALAVRHRLQWFIHLRVYWQVKGGKHFASPYTPHAVWHTLPFFQVRGQMPAIVSK